MTFLRMLLVAFACLVGVASTPVLAQSVRITVNDMAVTDAQIAARAKMLGLEGRGSNNSARQDMAADELINEAVMLSEANRLGVSVSEAQVSDAYLTVARNLKMSPDKLSEVLVANGVNPSTLKDRLRAGIAWGEVTQRAVVPRVQFNDLDLEQRAQEQVGAADGYDYILKEILFIVPQGGSAGGRTGEANRFRQSFSGCDSAVDLSLSYTDAAVLDVGRRHATQLPDPIASELAGLNVGGITKPRVVENGVSMLAVCSKDEARDLTFIKDNLRQEVGNELLKEESDEYLAELKAKARITRS